MADDDDDDRDIFTVALKEVAPTVILEYAHNCEVLLDKLENSHPHPDIIFLDLNMPRMGGRECLQKIKADNRYGSIPVIIYSTSAADEDVNLTFSWGASYFVTKPSSIEELKYILQYLLPKSFDRHGATLQNFVVRAKQAK